MANIFKTTLKKDIIANIANNTIKEIRFPITKFWATRLTDEYNLEERVFTFREFDALEVSSPSNKDTEGETFVLDFIRTYVDNDEFVVEFKMNCDDEIENSLKDEENNENKVIVIDEIIEDIVSENNIEDVEESQSDGGSNTDVIDEYETTDDSDCDLLSLLMDWFDDEKVMENFYADENVFATNARQVIVLPKGKVLGSKKTLPVNNDVEVRVEFDMNKKVYFDSIPDFDLFEEEVFRTLAEIRLNNFVFIWKRYTGIFQDVDGKVYFGIRYSTRKSIGFNRKYNVQ